MANKKISALTDLGATPAAGDILPITDVSDTTGSVNGTTKKVTVANLVAAAPQGDLVSTNNLNDLANETTARTNLGLGTAATLDVGTSDTNVVQLTDVGGTVKLPAVDGSQLTNLPSGSTFYDIVSETTTSRTLSDSDHGKVIVFSNSSGINVTIPDTLTTGFSCTIVQSGSGQVTVAASGSASVFGYGGSLSTAGQYASLNIIPTGSNAYIVEGELGAGPFNNTYSLSLDGTNDYAAIGTSFSALSGNKSFTGWFNFDNLYNRSIFGRAGATSYNHYGLILVNPSSLRLDLAGGVNRTFSGISPGIGIGTWYHIAITGDGTDLKLYINGSQVSSTLVDGDWSIGDFFNTGGYYYFDGLADEIGLWAGTTLSASDVLAIANTSATSGDKAVDLSTYTGLTHWWRFGDGDTSPTVSDNVGSNNLSIHGATFVTQVP